MTGAGGAAPGIAVRLLPMGEEALLVQVGSGGSAGGDGADVVDDVLALRAACAAAVADGEGVWSDVTEVVPAARTVLLVTAPRADLGGLSTAVREIAAGAAPGPPDEQRSEDPDEVRIEVVYDGPDLEDVVAATGLSREEVVAAHTGTPWRVGFGGFAPGFAYLVGGDPRLEVPRRADPRTRVPAGSVGLAGAFSGIYPRPSPGGWQLIGTTDAPLWDVDRTPPALLTPGRVVHFVEVGDVTPRPGGGVDTDADADADDLRRAPRALEVLATGPQALVEDEGRVGHLAVGVGRSGAADRGAYRLGQRLVGNPPGTAAVEVTLGGLRVRARGELVVCLTGAPAPAAVGGRPVGHASLVRLADGDELALGMPTAGLRTYVSVRGGIDVPAVLHSRSTDTMSGLGPEPLAAGAVLPVGDAPRDWSPVDQAATPEVASGEVVLDVTVGPRRDWFADPDALASTVWQVSDRSDRKGVRLTGTGLVRSADTRDRELPSEGMVRGAIQVPPGGEPVVLLTDHPVTGGYPVVGVVRPGDVDRAAQLVPGQSVRLRWREPGGGR